MNKTPENDTDHPVVRERASPLARAGDERFWLEVRKHYTPPGDFTHLEHGWYHPCTNAVLARQIETMREGQRRGSHYKRGEMQSDREAARSDLARVAGAEAEEIIITRNTTESLNIAILGMPLNAGDGVVHCNQDYPSVVEALEQRAARDRLVLQPASVPLFPRSDAEVVAAFAAAMTPKSRVLLITHLINHTGQVLPLKELCALGRSRGMLIIVDAAHSFAQLDFTLRDVDCDYFAASLHKWLGAPLGTGLLYVRRSMIEATTPFFADTRRPKTDVRKLEHFGNGPDCAYLGLREAIRWHDELGIGAKEARLRYLQQRWTTQLRTMPGVRVLTPAEPSRNGAIGVFSIEGIEPASVVKRLWDDYRIFVNEIAHPIVRGVRVTPGLPTSAAQIDRLIAAVREIATGGR